MRNYKAPAVLVIAVLALIFATINLRGQDANAPSREKKLTGKQKEHSKLYKEFEGKNKKIKDLTTAGKGDIKVGIIAEGEVDTPYSPQFSLPAFLENSVCDADAVVIGSVNSKDSQLTEAGEFIFTDYEIIVEEVLKDNPASHISSNGNIVVTRAGGEMLVNGRKVTAISEYLEPLSVGGRYLLFLRFIPTTGAYQAYNSRGSFQLQNNKITALTKEPLPDELKNGNDAASFINQIRIISICGKRK